MYTDKKTGRLPALLAGLAAILVIVLLAVLILHGSGNGIRRDSAAAIEQTIRRTAQQCYAVEGVYPPSLDYMQENYGLQVNTDDFYITYEAYASNQLPEIRVTLKNG